MTSVVVPPNAGTRRPGVPLRVEVCRSLGHLPTLLPDWHALLARCPKPSLFVNPAWHLAWWRAFGGGRTPHIVCLRDENSRLLGVVPLMRYWDRFRGFPVRVLGSYNNEHASRCDILVEAGSETQAAQALAAHLKQVRWQWDVVMLRQVPSPSTWLRTFVEACTASGLRPFEPTPGIGKCVVRLGQSWDAYMKSRSRHFRSRMRGNLHRVEKQGVVVYRRTNGAEDDFDVFRRLENSSWKGGDGFARLGDVGWAFQKELASASDAGISCHNLFLELNGRVVGGIHALGFARTLYSIQMMFDESVRDFYVGRAQFAVHIADALDDKRYDFLDLNGNSEFCRSWTDTELSFLGLQVYSRQPYSWLLSTLKRLGGRHR